MPGTVLQMVVAHWLYWSAALLSVPSLLNASDTVRRRTTMLLITAGIKNIHEETSPLRKGAEAFTERSKVQMTYK